MDETEKKKRIEIFTETLNGIPSNKPEYEFINKMTALERNAKNLTINIFVCFTVFTFFLMFGEGLFDIEKYLNIDIEKYLNNGLIKLYYILMYFSLFISIILSAPLPMIHQISSLDGITRIHKRIRKRRNILFYISFCFFIFSLIGLGLFFFN